MLPHGGETDGSYHCGDPRSLMVLMHSRRITLSSSSTASPAALQLAPKLFIHFACPAVPCSALAGLLFPHRHSGSESALTEYGGSHFSGMVVCSGLPSSLGLPVWGALVAILSLAGLKNANNQPDPCMARTFHYFPLDFF
jgi:hypothetical protein